MYKKNKVNLKNIKRIMTGKEKVRLSDRRSYSENLMDITSKKLNKRQKEIDKRLDLEVLEALNVKTSVDSKISYGGTSSKSVNLQIEEAKKKLL